MFTFLLHECIFRLKKDFIRKIFKHFQIVNVTKASGRLVFKKNRSTDKLEYIVLFTFESEKASSGHFLNDL